MQKVLNFVVRYVTLGLLGTLAILVLVPYVRASRTDSLIKKANQALAADRPEEAMQILERVAPWVSLHERFMNLWGTTRVRCLVRLGDLQSAEATAKAIFEQRDFFPASRFSSLFDHLFPLEFQKPLAALYLRSKRTAVEFDRTDGYNALAEELAQTDRRTELAELARRIAVDQPNDLAAVRVRAEIAALGTTRDVRRRANNTAQDHASLREKDLTAPKDGEPASSPQDAGAPLQDNLQAEATSSSASAVSQPVPTPEVVPQKWAVVRGTNTKAYDSTGKFLRVVPPGTVVEIESYRTSNVGELAVCRIADAAAPTQLLLILTGNLDTIRTQNPSTAQREKELRAVRARLEAELAGLKEINTQNPHAQEYAAAKKAYDEFWNRVRELQAKRDSAVGDKRMQYSDELYKLKGRSVEVGRRYEAAKKKYEEWQRTATAGDKANDPRAILLRTRLTEVERELSALTNGGS
ncbi:MAG: hypothetical protein ACUVWX_03760 [Kiritimatiellia bacterium]